MGNVYKIICVIVMLVGLELFVIHLFVNLKVIKVIVLDLISLGVIQDGLVPTVDWISMNVITIVLYVTITVTILKDPITAIVKMVICYQMIVTHAKILMNVYWILTIV
jgi:hypothetical protein